MNDINCALVGDLLPLYTEGLLSEESRAFVQEHLAACECCRRESESAAAPAEPTVDSALPLVSLRNRMRGRLALSVLLALSLCICLVICAYAALSAPQYSVYQAELFNITELPEGISIEFDDSVTDYAVGRGYWEGDSGKPMYTIEAWSSKTDRLLGKMAEDSILIPETDALIYYAQNNGLEDILLYGKAPTGGTETMPRLNMSYYFIIMAAAFALLAAAALILRKKRSGRILSFVAMYPPAWMLSQLLVRPGFVSYSLMRDMGLILLLSLFIFLVLLSGRLLLRLISLR